MFIPSGVEGLDEIIPGFPRGDLIIVAGRPGTGKTVFSASFLYNGASKYEEKGLYVSLTEDKATFMENMGSLGMNFEELEKRGLFEFAEFLTLREEGMKPLLSEFLGIIEEAKPRRLVVDSLSAALQGFRDPREVRVFLHALLSKAVKRLDCTTLLIEEIPHGDLRIGYGFEEFIASMIIILRTRFIEGRLFRELVIPKLRGARISAPITCFTIHKGVKVFPPWKPIEIKSPKPYQPLPEISGRYSTGIEQLDKILGGGIKKGSTILVDTDPKLTHEHYIPIINPIIANYCSSAKRPLIVLPSPGTSWERVAEIVKGAGMPEDLLPNLTRIIEPAEEVHEELPSFVITWKPESPERDFEKIAYMEDLLLKSTGHPPIKLIGVDRVTHYHGVKGAITLANLEVTRTMKLGSLAIWLVREIYPELMEHLAPLSSIHLRLIERNGRPILYGVKPRTGFYLVEMDESRGSNVAKLTPME